MEHIVAASTPRAAVFRTHAFGNGRVFALPTARSPQPYATAEELAKILSELDAADRSLAQMQDDARSASDREVVAMVTSTERSKILARVHEARSLLAADTKELVSNRAALLAPPPAVGHDAVLDVEARAAFQAAPEKQRQQLEREMSSGQHQRLVLALSRAIVPNPASDFGLRTWAGVAAKQHAERLQEMAAEEEGIAEIAAGLDAIVGAVS